MYLNIVYYCIDAYARRFDVLNRGFSGYNTEWALPIADTVRIESNYFD